MAAQRRTHPRPESRAAPRAAPRVEPRADPFADLPDGAFRLGFVTGATPDKWADAYRRRTRRELELVPVAEDDQESGVRDGSLDMALMRLPIDRTGLHCIPLYEERPVVVTSTEHVVTAVDEVSTAELADEQLVLPERSGWRPDVDQLAWPPMSEHDAILTAATGVGVAIVPMAVARLFGSRDVAYRPVTDLPGTTVGLCWLIDNDDPRVQVFIGVVRGRSRNSSRD
ncbi:LysR family substrate-binding domain-containing protein [Nocardioides acrostichi]|uniref:LysR family substrate-binding domain-containing protein n=1 Tax=Nocardioides acrostichi TaxID=2784339 RepID=A0A930UYB8_9ACTN|nr:LysR family substrate-binding domain-containing protein [Nocardioides acrostichi]MBF4163123.1 LysR family substrate-binding domain-containing protein [Nocardioides acrostichi]